MFFLFMLVLIMFQNFYIASLEIIFWSSHKVRTLFNLSIDFSNRTQILGVNIGLLHLLLGAGFCWAVLNSGDETYYHSIALFFLWSSFIASIVRSFTVHAKIILTEGIPIIIALIAYFCS